MSAFLDGTRFRLRPLDVIQEFRPEVSKSGKTGISQNRHN